MPFEHADNTVNKTADKVQSGGIESAIKDAYTGKKNSNLDFRPSDNPSDSINQVLPKLTIENGCSDSDNVAPSSKNGKYFPNKGDSSSDLGGRHRGENSKNKSEGNQDSQLERIFFRLLL